MLAKRFFLFRIRKTQAFFDDWLFRDFVVEFCFHKFPTLPRYFFNSSINKFVPSRVGVERTIIIVVWYIIIKMAPIETYYTKMETQTVS